MSVLLQVDFPFKGPWGSDMAKAMDRGLLHGCELVKQHGGRALRRQAMMTQPARPVAGAAVQLQKRVVQDFFGGGQRCGQQAGGRDGQNLFIHELQV